MQRQNKNSTQKGFHKFLSPHYFQNYLSTNLQDELRAYLCKLRPIWEERYSESRPPPEGEKQRRLLRPVYWLGNWQFACLGYFHPPKGVDFRCVRAEDYPPFLAQIVQKIERITKTLYRGPDMPKKWKLNTCLINYYGQEILKDKKIDLARVGEHQDFEPGPVASFSLGERALFQFVSGKGPIPRAVIYEKWLEDNSLMIFGGDLWKKQSFHRVQRVDKKMKIIFDCQVENFLVRRMNLTFRYVPEEYIQPFECYPDHLKKDLAQYVNLLGQKSLFYKNLIDKKK